MDAVLADSDIALEKGNIMVHCRGGVGRAALVACCLLIRKGYCNDASSAIAFLRQRRSPRAVETQRQEDYIKAYCNNKKQEN
jgi:protein-tyrosine phosphatase